GTTITWNNGNYITRVSSQGSNPCTFASTGSGNSWIEATITTDCGEITLPRKTVWSGAPQMPVDISFIPTTPCLDQWMYALVNSNNPPLADSYYEWRGSHDFIPQNPQATEVHFKT